MITTREGTLDLFREQAALGERIRDPLDPTGSVPTIGHDVVADMIRTPDELLEAPRTRKAPAARVFRDELIEEKTYATAVLETLRAGR